MELFPHHVLVWVSDMKRAVKFYSETLGLPLISQSDEFSQVGGERIWIALHLSSQSVEERSKTAGPVIVLKTENVEVAYQELRKREVQFSKSPYEASSGVTVAEFEDTEGNKLSLSTAE